MAGQKREREVERARYERQQARRAQRSQKTKRRERIIASIVVAVVVVAGFAYLASVLGANDDTTASPDSSLGPSDSPAATDCAAPNGEQPTSKTYTKPPPFTIKPKTTYTVTLATNCGDIAIELDTEAAPENSASFLGLAAEGFFDNTLCHRLTTEGLFVLQCGDPQGNGLGGPGYKLPNENLPEAGANNYPAGTVAMANSGKNTAGSQFFLVYEDSTLGADYTILGTMTSGLDIVQEVAAQGTANGEPDGAPAQPVQILTTDTTESD